MRRNPLVLLASNVLCWLGLVASEGGRYWEGVALVWAGALLVVWPDLAGILARARAFVRGHRGPICF